MSRSHRFGRRLTLERLESRTMLSGVPTVTASVSAHNLTIKGDGLADAVEVSRGATANSILITGLNGTLVSTGGTSAASKTVTGVTGAITLDMGPAGNKTVVLSNLTAAGNVSIALSAGNSTVDVGSFAPAGGVTPGAVSIGGSLSIGAGNGSDTVALNTLSTARGASIALGVGNQKIGVGEFTSTLGGTGVGPVTVGGNLAISTGAGQDNVLVGADTTPSSPVVVVAGTVSINHIGGGPSVFDVGNTTANTIGEPVVIGGGVRIGGDLDIVDAGFATINVEGVNYTLATGVSVAGSLYINSGAGDNAVDLYGAAVGGNLSVALNYGQSSFAAGDLDVVQNATLNLGSGEQNVAIGGTGGLLDGAVPDPVNIGGTLTLTDGTGIGDTTIGGDTAGQSVAIGVNASITGAENLTVGSLARVNGAVNVAGAYGSVDMGGAVGRTLSITGGAITVSGPVGGAVYLTSSGYNNVTIAGAGATATIGGSVTISMVGGAVQIGDGTPADAVTVLGSVGITGAQTVADYANSSIGGALVVEGLVQQMTLAGSVGQYVIVAETNNLAISGAVGGNVSVGLTAGGAFSDSGTTGGNLTVNGSGSTCSLTASVAGNVSVILQSGPGVATFSEIGGGSTLSIGGVQTLQMGSGNNVVTESNVTIDGSQTIHLGNGVNQVQFDGGATTPAPSATPVDVVGNLTITFGGGNNTLYAESLVVGGSASISSTGGTTAYYVFDSTFVRNAAFSAAVGADNTIDINAAAGHSTSVGGQLSVSLAGAFGSFTLGNTTAPTAIFHASGTDDTFTNAGGNTIASEKISGFVA